MAATVAFQSIAREWSSGERGQAHAWRSYSTRPAPVTPSAPPRLTPRQQEVLALLCEGLGNKLICRRLDISAGTAKSHISSILRELCVDTRLQAVVAAHRLGLVDAPDGESPK